MRVLQWYNSTYTYKKWVSTNEDGEAVFEQEAGQDKLFTAKCRVEYDNYVKTGWHRDDEQPNSKISTQVLHSKRDYICLPGDDPDDADSFRRVRDVRRVDNKAGRLVHYVVMV